MNALFIVIGIIFLMALPAILAAVLELIVVILAIIVKAILGIAALVALVFIGIRTWLERICGK